MCKTYSSNTLLLHPTCPLLSVLPHPFLQILPLFKDYYPSYFTHSILAAHSFPYLSHDLRIVLFTVYYCSLCYHIHSITSRLSCIIQTTNFSSSILYHRNLFILSYENHTVQAILFQSSYSNLIQLILITKIHPMQICLLHININYVCVIQICSQRIP